jgi:ABC-type branched-subunit amino acid transport system substrate-binding protein
MTKIDRRAAPTASASIAVAAALRRFASAQQTTVKLGVIYPMTGLFAYNGAQSMAGAEMAAAEINIAGGHQIT